MRCQFALLVWMLTASSISAECVELKILQRHPFAEGKSFGDVGPYERIVGTARFEIDPLHDLNKVIVDLDLAPRNKRGKVEFSADFCILVPKDPTKGNGAILYDVNNRGNKLALAFFNDGPSTNDPITLEHAGNGFLMRRGYTLVWSGWIGELLPGNHRLLLKAPVAKDVRGTVRFEFATDTPSDSLPLSRREGHGSYQTTGKDGELTYRMRETDSRIAIPRSQWSLVRIEPEKVASGVSGTLSQIRMKLAGGFRPGYIYELICECQDPIVQGVGIAGVRDLISFLKHETSDKNPIAREGASPLKLALAFGISQSGRFQRHFIYQGFCCDEKERKVFDGMMPHVAGGGLGFFNHRFAQPTRHNGQHEEHLYPADIFPFTYGESKHSYFDRDGKIVVDERSDGIFHSYSGDRLSCLPVVMHTQSATEYWQRSGSLVHTDPCGQRDAEIPLNVRIYAFGGTQHGPAADPPKPGNGDNLSNPGNFKPICRALLDALHEWAKNGKNPPDSVYPRIDQGTLVDWKQEATGFPSIPGVRYPTVIQQPSFLYLGERFKTRGIIDKEPPGIIGHYRVRVPRSDKDGNDLGTLLPPEVAIPLATHTGWNLRKREIGAEGMILSLQGSYIPLRRTKAHAVAAGDPRRSIEELYPTFDDYEKRFRHLCEEYVRKRYLLQEDADRLIMGRQKVTGLFAEKK